MSLPLSVEQVSLSAVLKCGQSFRWSVHAGPESEYRLCLRDRVVCLRQTPDAVTYRAVFPDAVRPVDDTHAWLADYFQLHVDLPAHYNQWAARDPVFAAIRRRFPGIRILRQDPWEALVSFICSSNNNIARITNMISALCLRFSPPLLHLPNPDSPTPAPYHPFPPPSALAAPGVPAILRSLGFGYRADFLHRTAKMLVDAHHANHVPDPSSPEPSEAWLMSLRSQPTQHARDELLKFVGVGRKVADCVLLMSLDKHDVVPVDTHVYQIAIKHYGLKAPPSSAGKKLAVTPKIYDDINARLGAVWGEYAGWAHSVLFTADLKSFATFGITQDPTPPSNKRKRVIKADTPPDAAIIADTAIMADETMAERVKRRRRGKDT